MSITYGDFNKLISSIDIINDVDDICKLINVSRNEAYYIILMNKIKFIQSKNKVWVIHIEK